MKGIMEKPTISTRQINNFNIWYETEDPDFIDISIKSNIPKGWLSYQSILSGPNKDSIIKPINRYVERLVPAPSLVSIDNNIVRLRQGNHAEIFLLERDDGSFYNVDRPWMRQYYNTDQADYNTPEDCFPGAYKFYTPWILDESISISIEPVENSPFYVYPQTVDCKVIPNSLEYLYPFFVPFHFKKVGSHMVTDQFGKIQRQSSMFDMVFSATDIIIEKIKDFYETKEPEHNQVLSTK
jgi:hypothetical protein